MESLQTSHDGKEEVMVNPLRTLKLKIISVWSKSGWSVYVRLCHQNIPCGPTLGYFFFSTSSYACPFSIHNLHILGLSDYSGGDYTQICCSIWSTLADRPFNAFWAQLQQAHCPMPKVTHLFVSWNSAWRKLSLSNSTLDPNHDYCSSLAGSAL